MPCLWTNNPAKRTCQTPALAFLSRLARQSAYLPRYAY